MQIIEKLDNLILNIKHVEFEQWQEFNIALSETLHTYEIDNRKDIYSFYTKGTAKDYHYNLKVGNGDGAVYVGYQHNSEKAERGSFTLKIEFNPSKPSKEQKAFLEVLKKVFKDKEKLIKGFDFALDINVPKDDIFIFSKTGRTQDRRKGTLYFGVRGKGGYLKVYDKKKELQEKQGVVVEEEYLTRVEYSVRLKEPITYDLVICASGIDMNRLYEVRVVDDLEKLDPVLKAMFYSYLSGFQDLIEFSYYYRQKIKKALDSYCQIDLDKCYQNAQEKLFKDIKDIFITDSIAYTGVK